MDPSLVVSLPIATGRSVNLSNHLLVLHPSVPTPASQDQPRVSIFYKNKQLLDLSVPSEVTNRIRSNLAAERRESIASIDADDTGGLVPGVTPFRTLRTDSGEFLAHSTPLRTPQEARYMEMAPDSPFYSPAVGMNMSIPDISMDLGSPMVKPSRRKLSTFPSTSAPSPTTAPVIADLSMPIVDRFTLRGADGNLYRASIAVTPTSPTIACCINALRAVVPAELFHDILAHIWSSKALLTTWEAFSAFLLSALTPVAAATGSPSTSVEKRKTVDSISFSKLLASSPSFGNSVAVGGFSKPLSAVLPGPSKDLHASPMRGRLVGHIADCLDAIHLVYEDSQLNNLVSTDQRFQLAQLLARLHAQFEMPVHVEYYQADFDLFGLEVSPIVPIAPRHARPPSIFQWIGQTIDAGAVLEDFPLPKTLFSCCVRIRKVCRIVAAIVSSRLDPILRLASEATNPDNFDATELISHKFERSPKPPKPFGAAGSGASMRVQASPSWQERAHFLLINVAAQEFPLLSDLETYPWAVVQPIREILFTCRRSPSMKWSSSVFRLIGREDLALQQERPRALLAHRDTIEVANSAEDNETVSNILSSGFRQAATVVTNVNGTAKVSTRKIIQNPDGIHITHTLSQMRFAKDDRLQEVGRLLRSSKPMRVKISEEGVAERDLIPAQQRSLVLLSVRQLATSVGRGAFTLGSECGGAGESGIVLTEKIHVPPLSLAGKLAGSNAGIALEGPHQIAPTGIAWGEFHNGVAAGLRISPEHTERVTSDWIASNRPRDAGTSQSSFAGVLLAMGLLGHLKHLAMTKVYEFLTTSNPLTSIAILLGLPAASYGTQSSQISRLLSVHIPALHPSTTSNELDLPALVQSSALIGLGLLNAASSQRRVSEVLMAAFAPGPDLVSREAYALSAGIGLGLVNLGQGPVAIGLADLKLPDKLIRCMNGGKMSFVEPSAVIKAEARTWLSVNSAAGAVAHGQGLVSRTTGQGAARGASAAAGGMGGRNVTGSAAAVAAIKDKPSLVLEGDEINTDITAPAAVFALGLMYLKSDDAFIASQLALPDTLVLLDQVRPDIQLLRICCHGLVQWTNIEPTEEYLHSQMPAVVRSRLLSASGVKGERGSLASPVFLTSAISSHSETEVEELISLRQTYLHVASGAALSIALKYAGSAHAAATALLRRLLATFMKLQKLSSVSRGGKMMLDLCCNVVALSWAIVMSGSGDLDALRHFRKLRKRVTPDTTYGTHMAISMAIGFLFLGGGRYSFGTTNKAVAALLISIYPLFPGATTDSRYHSQALRHMYVLAAESRSLCARDVDTLRPVYVPVDVYVKVPTTSQDNAATQTPHTPTSTVAAPRKHSLLTVSSTTPLSSPMLRRSSHGIIPAAPEAAEHLTSSSPGVTKTRMMLPCLLPPLEWIVQIDVVPDRYWPVSLRPSRNESHLEVLRRVEGAALLVKRRAGHLSYAQDPHHSRSLLKRATPQRLDFALPVADAADGEAPSEGQKQSGDFLSAFSDDPTISAFAKHFCHPRDSEAVASQPTTARDAIFSLESTPSTSNETSLAAFSRAVLYECISHDKPEMVMTYLHLWNALQLSSASRFPRDALLIKLLSSFYNFMTRRNLAEDSRSRSVPWTPLLSIDLVSSAVNKLKSIALNQSSIGLAKLSPVGISAAKWAQFTGSIKMLGLPTEQSLFVVIGSALKAQDFSKFPTEAKSILVSGLISKLPAVRAHRLSAESISQLSCLFSQTQ